MAARRRGVAWTLAVACVLALAVTPKVSSDPLPTPEPWAGGRIVPAKAVAVDMVSEDLSAVITPQAPKPGERHYRDEPAYDRCDAKLTVKYVLRSDTAQKVPIVFPIVGEVSAVAMAATGQALKVQLLPELRLFAAYEAQWKQVIEAYLQANPRAAGWGERARRQAAADPGELHSFPYLWLAKALERRLRLQGLGEKAHMAGWDLGHCVMGDWGRWTSLGALMKPKDPDLPDRVRLWMEREVAVALNPATPDPVALWQGAGDVQNVEGRPLENLLQAPMCRMTFAVCELPLGAGDNEVTVKYSQQVGIVIAHDAITRWPGAPPRIMGTSANELSFILRTARFWRSFGKLKVKVTLPVGTRYAECSLPGSKVSTSYGVTTVSYAGEGLPAQNLHVAFAAFQPAPKSGKGLDVGREQAPLGTPPSDLATVLAGMPESGPVTASKLRVSREVPSGTPHGWVLVAGVGAVVIVVGLVALKRRRG